MKRKIGSKLGQADGYFRPTYSRSNPPEAFLGKDVLLCFATWTFY